MRKPCVIGKRCERHDFVHGAEAEEDPGQGRRARLTGICRGAAAQKEATHAAESGGRMNDRVTIVEVAMCFVIVFLLSALGR